MPGATATATATESMTTLLAQPPADAIAAPLRRALLEAPVADPYAGAPDAPAILDDTLASLARLGADGDVAAAAILHALPALRTALQPRLEREFPGVAVLLDGQRAAAQVWALHAEQQRGNSEGLRRLLLAIVRDLRVVPILLARHLARLRVADQRPQAQRLALAQLTRDIHAPLANRLGIWQLKWELEDLAFRHLEAGTYQRIARLLDDKRRGREQYVESVKAQLRDALAAQGVVAEVAGRPKHIYSIWKKMQKKDVPIGELYDLRALRVLVDDIPACYAALGVVHATWMPLPSEFDDYIARPKRNDYRSLHTAVIGPEGKTVEVQIRTHEMHAQAELGVAAHWKYKEGGGSRGSDAAMEKRIAWMRRLLEAPSEDGGLLRELDSELVEDRVYVLTPRGEVIDLPQGATPLDFAYHVHTEVGHRCRGAKVDDRIVTLDHVLRSGDRVEILTGKVAEPRRDWLVVANGFLASPRSREKVRSWFHKLDRARNLQAGRELLDKELRRLGLLRADLAPVLAKFNAASDDDLYVLVALGDVGPHQVGRLLLERERAQHEPEDATHVPVKARSTRRPSGFTVEGMDNLLVQPARCCQPLPGEAIVGYLTRGRGVSVHRRQCATFLRLSLAQPQRVLPVEWGTRGSGNEVDVVIAALDRKWLLKDVTTLIAQEGAHVTSIRSDAGRAGRTVLRLRLRVDDFGQLGALLGKLNGVSGVEDARRGS
jgi:GTP pyrophosphokinase